MGRYHGQWSFETFTHRKGALAKSTHLDIPVRCREEGPRGSTPRTNRRMVSCTERFEPRLRTRPS